jgi:hypothetical protein
VLSDIIGLEDGLGVECLSGSGAIASAYCKAFRYVQSIRQYQATMTQHQNCLSSSRRPCTASLHA